jgi:hypothetical protein
MLIIHLFIKTRVKWFVMITSEFKAITSSTDIKDFGTFIKKGLTDTNLYFE